MPILPYYLQGLDADGAKTYTPQTNLPTIDELRKTWCFGIPLVQDDGSVMDDETLYPFVEGAVAYVERELGVFLKPTVIACNPWERGLSEGVDYEREEPPYDYDARSWMNYGFLQLRERHVREVTGFKLVLPNGNIIMDFKKRPEWIKLYPEAGQIHLVPYAGDPTMFALLGGSVNGYPFVTGTMYSNLPQMLYVDYTAGYAQGKIPKDVRNIVAKIVAVEILGTSGNAITGGLTSLNTSIDGLSESTSYMAAGLYSDQIKQYQQDIADFFDPKKGAARSVERGITFTAL